jgi:hypothetical protein
VPRTRKLLVILLTSGVLTIGTAVAIEKRPEAAESNVSSKELLEAAQSAYEIHKLLYQRGADATEEDVYVWSKRLMMAERDLNPAAGEAAKAVQAHLERMDQLEAITKARREAARATGGDVAAAKYYRTEAELMRAQTRE